jgi:hypothetical protein
MMRAQGGNLRRMCNDQDLPTFGQSRQPTTNGICGGATNAAINFIKNHCHALGISGQAHL